MAFNRSKFNQIPFNVKSDMVQWLSVSAEEEVSAVIGSALEYYPLAIGNERVNATATCANTIFIAASGAETINEGVTEAQLSVILFPHFEESVTEEIMLSAEIMPTVSGNEQITGNLVLGSNSYLIAEANETIDANTALGADNYITADGYELVSESASLENIEQKTCVLTLTLEPGQILIVDANNYNVLLDNENAIETQSGDWIDELNRGTTDITISAASGLANLSATILYTERYL